MHHISTFQTLAHRLRTFGQTAESCAIIAAAQEENPWFTEADIVRAVDAICRTMLQRESLEEWLARYTRATEARRVAVIMAGNLPLVGFFDLLCILLAGHECHYKPSSKDRVLMEYVVRELRDIEPTLALHRFDPTAEYDMLIATGGDAAVHHFDTHYPTTRRLLRGSRHSVAVLSGNETGDELEALCNDITAYSGLGCRSVSMLFVPRGYTPKLESPQPTCEKLRRNLRSERALRTMTAQPYTDCGGFILTPGNDFPTSLATVTLYEYDSLSEVSAWLESHKESIQCVVSHVESLSASLPYGRIIPFGRAQYPALEDYADGLDLMQWLTE